MAQVWKTVSGTVNTRLRGTNQQTDTGLLYVNGSYTANGTTAKLEGISVASFSIQNNSGGAATVGFGYRIPNRLWKFGYWDDSATPAFLTDDTDAKDVGADDVVLELVGTNDDGWVVASSVPFNAISLNVTTASVDATDPVRAARYSNTAGTGWTNFTTADLIFSEQMATEMAAGENLIVFTQPLDWGRWNEATMNVPVGYYAVNVRATTAPDTTAALAGTIELWNFPYLKKAVADGATLEFIPTEPLRFPYADAVHVLIGTADEDNQFFAQVSTGVH